MLVEHMPARRVRGRTFSRRIGRIRAYTECQACTGKYICTPVEIFPRKTSADYVDRSRDRGKGRMQETIHTGEGERRGRKDFWGQGEVEGGDGRRGGEVVLGQG